MKINLHTAGSTEREPVPLTGRLARHARTTEIVGSDVKYPTDHPVNAARSSPSLLWKGVIDMTHTFTRAMYVCRGCGTECAYPNRFVKCPVCGIKWG